MTVSRYYLYLRLLFGIIIHSVEFIFIISKNNFLVRFHYIDQQTTTPYRVLGKQFTTSIYVCTTHIYSLNLWKKRIVSERESFQ